MTALRKPSGGVRGIVVGDTFRRGVSRICGPGTECVGHAIQALTDLHPDSTVLSVDGIGAFDLVSREAMLLGLPNMEGGDTLLPLWFNSTGNLRNTSGRMMRGSATPFLKGKGENKATPGALLLGTTQFTCCCSRDLAAHRMMAFLDDINLVSPTGADRNCAPIVDTGRDLIACWEDTDLEQEWPMPTWL